MTTFLIIILIVVAVLAEVVFVRCQRLHPKAQPKGRRGAGTGADWGRQAQPKPVSEAELMRIWMMQQMGVGARNSQISTRRNDDDEQPLTF